MNFKESNSGSALLLERTLTHDLSGDLSADRIRKALSTINTQVGPMLTTFGIDAEDLVVRFYESNIAAAATAASSMM